MRKTIFLPLILFLALFQNASAEIHGDIIIAPEYPKAYEQVSARLQSYSFDVDLAFITWKVDGVVIDSGLGKKSITLKAKGTGEITNIEANVVLGNNDSATFYYNLSPQSVDLVWEAVESQVPPFYEGKALPGENSLIRVTALPSFVEGGRLINPALIAYNWSVNDETLPSLSGTGRQTLTSRLDYLSDNSVIAVTAKSPTGGVAESRITIYPSPIYPVFYQYDDILGINRSYAIINRLETKKEITLKLFPYFMSKIDKSSTGEEYSWSLDGLPVKTENDTTITLKPKDNSYGSKKLVVNIENAKRYLQQATAELLVVFDSRK